MAKTNYWILLVFASEAYMVVVPIFLLACSIYFGFHTMLNIPAFGEQIQARAITNSFSIIEFLNGLGFIVLLVNLVFAFRRKNTKGIINGVFFLGLSVLVLILVYPATVLIPTF
jgi:hypothetical protein